MGFFFNPTGKTGMLMGLGLMIIILFLRVENAIKKRFNKEK